MDYTYCMSSLGAASAATPALFEDVSAHRAPHRRNIAAPNKSSPNVSFDLPKGTWFDETISLLDPYGDTLTKLALSLIAKTECRKRKRRPADEANLYTIVRSLLANGIRCHHFRRPSTVAYFRKADGYVGKAAWLSGKALSRAVDALSSAGLAEATQGERGVASTYRVTKKLVTLAEASGISGGSFALSMPSERLVRLREGNSKGPQISFASNDETLLWTALLAEYNAFARQHDIGIALTEEEEEQWVHHWNKKRAAGGLPLRRPERFRTDIYRQFNNSSFEEGGRLYGGWWQYLPKEFRHRIEINGQSTIELDYAGCAIRMLYHERGIDYLDDPYKLPAIIAFEKELGLPSGHYRDAIKAMTQALINDRNGDQPEQIQLPKGLSFRPHFKREEIRRMIEDKHAPIADAFGTGTGLRLQRRDSDLALAIITAMKEQGILALPVHDSFIVIEEKKDKLKHEMDRIYNDIFSYRPIIS